MNIRVAAPGDERHLAMLNGVVHGPHVANRPDSFKPTRVDEVAAWFKELLGKPTARIWIADDNGAPVGYVLVLVHERPENPFNPPRRWCEIDQIAVNPEWQRRGIGRMLIERVLAWVREEGIGDVELSAWSFNGRAQRAFRGLGFTPKLVRFERKASGNPADQESER